MKVNTFPEFDENLYEQQLYKPFRIIYIILKGKEGFQFCCNVIWYNVPDKLYSLAFERWNVNLDFERDDLSRL